ncbi:spexin-like isoform X2 [Nerophis ophidion]|nr:spexin-like isoform X2 [Nerophis ophidion]
MPSVATMVVMVTLASQCCAAPQRRNWTPQAILYLRGRQGRRSLEKDNTHSATPNLQAGDRQLRMSLLLCLYLELLGEDWMQQEEEKKRI